MKKIDIKSFLIGVLITTNLFLIMGFRSNTNSVQYYNNDDIMNVVQEIQSELSSISSDVSEIYSIHLDVSSIKDIVEDLEEILEDETREYGYGSIKYYLREIYEEL